MNDIKNRIYKIIEKKQDLISYLDKIEDDMTIVLSLEKILFLLDLSGNTYYDCDEYDEYYLNENYENYDYLSELFSNLNHNIKFKTFDKQFYKDQVEFIKIIIEYCMRNNDPFYRYINLCSKEMFKIYYYYFHYFEFSKEEFNRLFMKLDKNDKIDIYENYSLCVFDFDQIPEKYFSYKLTKEKFKLKQQEEQLIKKNKIGIKSARN